MPKAVSRRYDDAFGIAATEPENVLEVVLLYRLLKLFLARLTLYMAKKFSNCVDIPTLRLLEPCLEPSS
jgi:hypothetical protein